MKSSIRFAHKFARMNMLLVVAWVSGSSLPAAAEPERLQVTLDQAKVVRMPGNAQTVIIGNPIVADVTVLKNHSMVLTGKGFGVTNMIALDSQGNPVAETMIEVTAATDKVLVLQRGLDRESYSCVPQCMPVVAPGDSTTFTTSAVSGITTRNTLAAPGAGK